MAEGTAGRKRTGRVLAAVAAVLAVPCACLGLFAASCTPLGSGLRIHGERDDAAAVEHVRRTLEGEDTGEAGQYGTWWEYVPTVGPGLGLRYEVVAYRFWPSEFAGGWLSVDGPEDDGGSIPEMRYNTHSYRVRVTEPSSGLCLEVDAVASGDGPVRLPGWSPAFNPLPLAESQSAAMDAALAVRPRPVLSAEDYLAACTVLAEAGWTDLPRLSFPWGTLDREGRPEPPRPLPDGRVLLVADGWDRDWDMVLLAIGDGECISYGPLRGWESRHGVEEERAAAADPGDPEAYAAAWAEAVEAEAGLPTAPR